MAKISTFTSDKNYFPSWVQNYSYLLHISKTENFENHETRIIFLRARPLKKKKYSHTTNAFSQFYPGRVTRYKICQRQRGPERERERERLSQHPVVCYFWPGNCGEVTSACSRFQNRGTKGRHENMTLVGAALLFAKLLMLHASLFLSLPPSSLFPCVFAGAVITGTITCCAACLM